MLNKVLLKEVERGLPGALYYIWSEEGSFLDDALSRFIETVIESNPVDFNYDVFDSSSEVQEILDAAATLPFMAQRRLVVLKDFNNFSAPAKKNLTPYLNNPSDTTCMLILSRKAPRATWNFNWKTYSLNIKDKDIPLWMKRIASEKGIQLTDDAIYCLLEFVGYDPGLLMNEIEKMALLGKKTITDKDVMTGTSMMREFSSFDLLDSLITGQKTRTFRILNTMFARNAAEAPVIIGTLNWHFKQFYSLWLNKGKRPVKMREKTFRAMLKYLPDYNEEDFYQIFRKLHEADLTVKTSGRPELVVEVLIIKLLQKGSMN